MTLIFSNILVRTDLTFVYHVTKQFKPWKVPTVVGSIVVVVALTVCALLQSVWDLKTAPMNA